MISIQKVEKIVQILFPSLKSTDVDYDDIMSDACLGMVKGYVDFDLSKGDEKHHIFAKIKYEILDGMRSRSWLVRKDYQEFKKAGIPIPRIICSCDCLMKYYGYDEEKEIFDFKEDETEKNPGYNLEIRDYIELLLGLLTEEEQHIIIEHFLYEKTLREVGEITLSFHKLLKLQKKELCNKLHKQGLSSREISAISGIHFRTVKEWVKRKINYCEKLTLSEPAMSIKMQKIIVKWRELIKNKFPD